MPCSFIHADGEQKCQFQLSNKFVTNIDGDELCIFHSPLEDKKGTPIEKSSQIFLNLLKNHIETARNNSEDIIDLRGTVFPQVELDLTTLFNSSDSIDISHCVFTRPIKGPYTHQPHKIYASHTKFLDTADFSSKNLGALADFGHAYFRKSANFTGTEFVEASFHNARFEEGCTFKSSNFIRRAQFSFAIFGDKDNPTTSSLFQECAFSSHVTFNNAIFLNELEFLNNKCGSLATFYKTIFNEEVSFTDNNIGSANFKKSIFHDIVYFNGSIFRSRANFSECNFQKEAFFLNSVLKDNSFFESTLFQSSVDFSAHSLNDPERIFSNIHFTEAVFEKDAVFVGRDFKGVCSFQKTKFHIAPNFHGCTIPSSIRFDGSEFMDRDSDDAEHNYRKLRMEMEQQRNRAEEARFYAYEEESRRAKLSWKNTEWWVSSLYGVISGYGRDFVRPAVGLLLTWLGFGIGYALYATDKISSNLPFDWHLIWKSLALSFQQITAPFSSWRSDPSICTDCSITFIQVIAAFQSAISLTLLALMILGLRWRFKRG